MIDRNHEPPVDLSLLSHDASRRAERITQRVSSRIANERNTQLSATIVLARWSIPMTIAAAASVAILLLTQNKSDGDAFAAFVVPGAPAAAWVTTGQAPDISEVIAMVGETR